MDKASLTFVYEDDCIIVVRKPAGLATQSANVTQKDCVTLIREHIVKNSPGSGKEPYVGVIHRLDQPVEGLLVFAKDKKSAAILSSQIREGTLGKYYHALVEGITDCPVETKLTDYMYKDPAKNMAVITDGKVDSDKAKISRASLFYRTEKILEDRNMTILSIKLETGRFHQIRAQLSHIGHPIVGDTKYGAVTTYPKGIALIADRLEFTHPRSGEKVEKIVDFSFSV